MGENLHEHPQAGVAYRASATVQAAQFARRPRVRLRSDPAGPVDLQMLFTSNAQEPRWRPGPGAEFTVGYALMTPASRGSLRLNRTDPGGPPLIDPNYLADERDVERMVVGLRRAREVGETEALSAWRDHELVPGPAAHDDAALRDAVRQTMGTLFHVVGTCRIGTDDGAAVDPNLRVHGVDGLRIADASVMPSIVSTNTCATVLAIAERAAAVITGQQPST